MFEKLPLEKKKKDDLPAVWGTPEDAIKTADILM